MAKLPAPASSRTAPSRPLSTDVPAPLNSVLIPRRDHAGNSVVGRLHHAADRLRAETQGGRPADDLDLVGDERVDRHEMVLAQIGRAVGADAILLDAHAIDVEAANDRAAGGAGGKARAGDARLAEQQVAERAGAVATNFLVRHDRHGGELIGDDWQRALQFGGRCRLARGY